MDGNKTNQANQVKDQAATRARQSYENKKKDPNFVSPQLDGHNNLVVIFENNNVVDIVQDSFRRRGK